MEKVAMNQKGKNRLKDKCKDNAPPFPPKRRHLSKLNLPPVDQRASYNAMPQQLVQLHQGKLITDQY